ncbi:2OG-Fe(II) oxygenase family protein [Idiomarina sp.]|uniref:2OG-Fe(II) oxygenase family protein n=1 Tax=Idiomarina sp. TaxID=1874361 RepID=UPI003A90FA30
MSKSLYIKHYNFAIELVKSNRFKEAEQELTSALGYFPNAEKAYLLKAQCLASMGKRQFIQQASQMVERFLKTNLNHRRAQRIWAEVNWRLDNPDWTAFYNKALSEKRPQLPLVYDYARLLLQAEDYSSVISLLEKFDPNESVNEFAIMRAHVQFKTKNYEQALKSIEKVIASGNKSAATLRTKAKCELALKLYQQALHSARQLIAISKKPEQGDWALLASVFKAAELSDSYQELYDFERFVSASYLPVPSGFSTRRSFHQELSFKLEKLHGSSQHPLEQSLRNGSQTDGHLFSNCSGATQHLATAIKEYVAQWSDSLKWEQSHPFLQHSGKSFDFTGSWSVKLRNNGYHKSHYHNEGWISGCYYVAANKELTNKGQGWLKLGESELLEEDYADYFIRPEEGLIVLFPSYFWHGTTPFQSRENRLTVAFDIYPEE